MPMQWDARRVNVEDIKRLEARATADAQEWARRIWQEGLPGGLIDPIAVRATYEYIARLRQESSAIPRWAWASQEAMRGYIQMTGDRYYEKFTSVLCTTIGRAIYPFRALPRTTPLPAQMPDLVTPLIDEYQTNADNETDRRDWSGAHPTEGAS